MAQTYQRHNQTKKDSDVFDQRRSINSKETKSFDKYKNRLYDLLDDIDEPSVFEDEQQQ